MRHPQADLPRGPVSGGVAARHTPVLQGYKLSEFAVMTTCRSSACLCRRILSRLSVGVMAVPQSLSYARVAGLPSEYGLYGIFAPVSAYALFGSSRQLVSGAAVCL